MAETPSFHTPTKDRAPIRSNGWRGASSRSHVSGADADTVASLGEMARLMPGLSRSAPVLLATMRDHLAGQPQAASYGETGDSDRNPRAGLWCDEHQQTTDICDEQRRVVREQQGWTLPYCEGVKINGPADPAGEAALVTDRAQQDLVRFRRHIERAQREFRAAMAIRAMYPGVPTPPPDAEELPGDDLCRCCWKHNKYPQLIERMSNGTPYYSQLCRWCGSTRAALKGDRMGKGNPAGDPPTWLVTMHIDHGRVPAPMVDKAKAEMDAKVEQHVRTKANQVKRKKKRK